MEPTTRASGPISVVLLTITAVIFIGCAASDTRSSPPQWNTTLTVPIEAQDKPVVQFPNSTQTPREASPSADPSMPTPEESEPIPSRIAVRVGPNPNVTAGETVTIEAEFREDSDVQQYAWRQVSGPLVQLLNADAPIATFVAPDDLSNETALVFEVSAEDREGTVAQQVTVSVANAPLSVNAGTDRSIVLGDGVYLDGVVSGGTPGYTYRWTPTTGLNSSVAPRPLAAPRLTTTYTLTVTDSTGAVSSDTVTVTLASGRVYFVATGAIGASDANSGIETRPWKTLAKAASVARAGDTVLVRTGVYKETFKPQRSGTSAARTVFKARGGESVVLDGQNLRSTGIDLSAPASFVRIEGFEIRNHTGTGVFFQAWGSQGVTGVEVVGNRIHDNKGDAISARNSENSLIENNEIFANGITAIAIGGKFGSSNLIVRGNDIHYNGKDGLQGGGNGVIVEHNLIYDQFHTNQHQDGLDVSGIRDLVVRYNTIFDVTQPVYVHNQEGPCDRIRVYGNVFYTDRYATVKGGESPGVFVDARFAGDGVTDVQVHSNTFGWTGYSGVRMFGTVSGVVLRNNIFYESGIGLGATSVTNVSSDYNVFFKSVIPSAEGSHSRTGDPQFKNYSRHSSWDFHLLPVSPALNAGDSALGGSVALPSDFHDIDRRERPRGQTFDAGAFEY